TNRSIRNAGSRPSSSANCWRTSGCSNSVRRTRNGTRTWTVSSGGIGGRGGPAFRGGLFEGAGGPTDSRGGGGPGARAVARVVNPGGRAARRFDHGRRGGVLVLRRQRRGDRPSGGRAVGAGLAGLLVHPAEEPERRGADRQEERGRDCRGHPRPAPGRCAGGE